MYMSKGKKISLALGLDSVGENFSLDVDISEFLIPNSEDQSCKDPDTNDIISSPHSNSFVDLNGDCMPDIFLQKQRGKTIYENYYEIYIQKLHKGK
jgi:hypothetical protein